MSSFNERIATIGSTGAWLGTAGTANPITCQERTPLMFSYSDGLELTSSMQIPVARTSPTAVLTASSIIAITITV
ncbi:uncharacterized protein N7469_004552 [Penicillium citrinum]|uniref:Uncharacterized protein n=2 Tax=Penicillium TaxID=5073 RepID=A0A9W9P4Q9_PENCI|nr:uncharacterized protein N7469_004552 [Penicillium citrinum]KAJ5235384.1 hypothetical protein N7469_004552 [Penicillium citrinum]KAJ5591013.1 hypothetical protein N7450_004985 [Penicillium hetheringtonii]